MGVRHHKKALSLTLLAALLGAGVPFAAPSAEAQSPPSLVPWQYYIRDTNSSDLYNEGCRLGSGIRSQNSQPDALVILDWGQPALSNGVWGTTAFNNGYASPQTIESGTEQFASGFYICTGSDTGAHLRITLGTNNYRVDRLFTTTQMQTLGATWRNMAEVVWQWLVSSSASNQVDVAGGIDAEVAWSAQEHPYSFATGWNSSSATLLYDFGDAAGCPTSYNATIPQNTSCTSSDGVYTHTWGMSYVYGIAWYKSDDYALPEIYTTNGSQATEWANISLWGYLYASTGKLVFSGETTQYYECSHGGYCPGADNTPSAGWSQLYNAVNQDDPNGRLRQSFAPNYSIDFCGQFNDC